MNEIRYDGNIFLLPEKHNDAACVTTNGILKADGRLVMGAGIARYCRDSHRDIDLIAGHLVKRQGNHAYFLGSYEDAARKAAGLPPYVFVCSFPTKHHWRDMSSLALIRNSAIELVKIAAANNFTRIFLPPAGCGLGGLDYASQVRPILSQILGDGFTMCLPSHIYDGLQ